jgi:SOS-response transcriptional repressor LexA
MTEQQAPYDTHPPDEDGRARPSKPMSRRRAEILAFLYDYTAAHGGMSPTIREIGEAVGTESTSTVYYNLRILRDQGFVTFGGDSRKRHIGIVGARYINPPLPREAKRVLGYGDEVTDPLFSQEQARTILATIQKWRDPAPIDEARRTAVDEAMREAIMRAERQLAQRIEDQILGDRDGR